jgi:hypothetical protein
MTHGQVIQYTGGTEITLEEKCLTSKSGTDGVIEIISLEASSLSRWSDTRWPRTGARESGIPCPVLR